MNYMLLRQYFIKGTLFLLMFLILMFFSSIKGYSHSLFDESRFKKSSSSSVNRSKLPIKAQVEVILPIYRGMRLRNSDFFFPVLKKIFTNVKLRGKIRRPHFSLFLRVETEKRDANVFVKIHMKFNTGSGRRVARLTTEASSGITYGGAKKAYNKAFNKAYVKILYKLVTNRSLNRIVRRGLNNSITRKTSGIDFPKISSRYRNLNDSVGTIKVLGVDGRGKAGSGFFISSNGLMLTNHHVISKAKNIWVRLTNKRTYPAIVVAKDAWMDIALLKVKTKGNKFIPLDLGFRKYKIGDEVIAIGSPLSNEETISKGILSSVKNVSGYQVIQTDTAINRGNSGGPLIHLQSRKLIGINTLKRANGIAYAMSLRTISSFIRENHKIVKISSKGKVVITKRISFKAARSYGVFTKALSRKRQRSRLPLPRLGKKFGVTVYSDSVSRSTHTRSAREMSSLIGKIIAKRLNKMSRDSTIAVRVQGFSARKYIYEGKSAKYSKRLCRKYQLDGVVNFSFGSGSGGSFDSAEVEVAFFDCRAERKYNGLYSVRLTRGEVNPYGIRIKAVVTKLLRLVRK